MRWLDRFIDRMRHPTQTSMTYGSLGPFGRGGSTIGVLLCGLLIAAGVVAVLQGIPFAVAFLVVVAILGVLVLRICVRSWRGDFDLDPPA